MSSDEPTTDDASTQEPVAVEEAGPQPETSADAPSGETWLNNPVYMVLAVAVFAVLIGVTLAIVRNRDDGARLVGAQMTLELTYPLIAEPTAVMDGQPGTAPAGAMVSCRTVAQPHQRLGEGAAGQDGSFRIELDPAPWPLESLGGDLYNQLNTSIECRAGTGDWVRPLRPPRVSVA